MRTQSIFKLIKKMSMGKVVLSMLIAWVCLVSSRSLFAQLEDVQPVTPKNVALPNDVNASDLINNGHTADMSSYRPDGILTLGAGTSGEETGGFVDVIAPVLGNDSQILFINPRGSLEDESQNEQNIGLGARKLFFNDRAILGANVFYDSRESSYKNRYDQWGVGLELLTDWVDARTNFYFPTDEQNIVGTYETQDVLKEIQTTASDPYFTEHEVRQDITQKTTTTTTTHHFDKFEGAMDGVDVEVGVKVPIVSKIADTRVFAGYYAYNSNFKEDLKGMKARLEVRAAPGVIFDAEWYEDDGLNGSNYYVGGRVRLPFEIGNLFKGKNPFEGAKSYFSRRSQDLKERLTDMVIRDLDVITEESDFLEDAKKLKIDKKIEVKKSHKTLMDDITFVDQDNGSGDEDGRYENPYNTIQEGVDNAFGDSYVYVDDEGVYDENVVLKENVKLWGSGYKIFGIESGVRPTVDGGGRGPTITMADNTEIWGMHVINSGRQSGSQPFNWRVPDDNDQVLRDPGTEFQRRDNDLRLTSSHHNEGLNHLLTLNNSEGFRDPSSFHSGRPSLQRPPQISSSGEKLSDVGIYANNCTNIKIINGNLIEGTSGAIYIDSDRKGDLKAEIHGNILKNNRNGIGIIAKNTGNFDVKISGNKITSDSLGGFGIFSRSLSMGENKLEISNNSISNHLIGVASLQLGLGNTILKLNNNHLSSNKLMNALSLAISKERVDVEAVGNKVTDAYGFGMLLGAASLGTHGHVQADVSGNYFQNNKKGNLGLLLKSKGTLDFQVNDNKIYGNSILDSSSNRGLTIKAESSKGMKGEIMNNIIQGHHKNFQMDVQSEKDEDITFMNNVIGTDSPEDGFPDR